MLLLAVNQCSPSWQVTFLVMFSLFPAKLPGHIRRRSRSQGNEEPGYEGLLRIQQGQHGENS